MAKGKEDYRDQLKRDFGVLFENLQLQERQQHYLKARWLDQVLWMEGRAAKARDWYYKLRLTAIIGGVIVPILAGLNFDNRQFSDWVRGTMIGLSTVVAISAAVEEFFHYGERWRHYRRSVETLKTQGWQYFELSGPYQRYTTHEQAFATFSNQVEEILQRDVEVYATQLGQSKKEEYSTEGGEADDFSSPPSNPTNNRPSA
jgi:hypothetical protein